MSDEQYGLCEHWHVRPCPYCLISELRREVRWLQVQCDALSLQRDQAVSDLRRLQFRQKRERQRRYRETGA